jgi:hypothetical protein
MANDYPVCLKHLRFLIEILRGGYVRCLSRDEPEKCWECGNPAEMEVRAV